MLELTVDSSYIYDIRNQIDNINIDDIVSDLISLEKIYKQYNVLFEVESFKQLSEKINKSSTIERAYININYKKSVFYNTKTKSLTFDPIPNNTIFIYKFDVDFKNKTSLGTIGKYIIKYSENEISEEVFIKSIIRNIRMNLRKGILNKVSLDYESSIIDVISGYDILSELTSIKHFGYQRYSFELEKFENSDLELIHQFIEENLLEITVLNKGFQASMLSIYYDISEFLNIGINKKIVSDLINNTNDIVKYLDKKYLKYLTKDDVINCISVFRSYNSDAKCIELLSLISEPENILIKNTLPNNYEDGLIFSLYITEAELSKYITSSYNYEIKDLSKITVYIDDYDKNIARLKAFEHLGENAPTISILESLLTAKEIKDINDLEYSKLKRFSNYRIIDYKEF